MLPSVVATDLRWGRGGRRRELQPVLATVPVCAGHGDVQAEDHKLQPEEADISVELGEFVLAGGGVCQGGGVSGVLEVTGVVTHLQATPGASDDAASPEARGAGTIGKSSSSSDTF